MCNAGLSPMSCRLNSKQDAPGDPVTDCERVSAFKLRLLANAGGTAEGLPFVPIVGMMGIIFLIDK